MKPSRQPLHWIVWACPVLDNRDAIVGTRYERVHDYGYLNGRLAALLGRRLMAEEYKDYGRDPDLPYIMISYNGRIYYPAAFPPLRLQPILPPPDDNPEDDPFADDNPTLTAEHRAFLSQDGRGDYDDMEESPR